MATTTNAPKKKAPVKRAPAKKSVEAKAAELKISTVGDFKNRIGGIFQLPSGMVVRLRNPGGLTMFLSSGNIPNSLMSVVKSAMSKGKGVEDVNLSDEQKEEKLEAEFSEVLKDDPDAINEMAKMMDNIAVRCMIQPKCHPVPSKEEEREDHLLYADEVDLRDKQWMFQWITSGVKELEPFRSESK